MLETSGSIRVPKARGGDRHGARMTETGWLEPEIALERKIIRAARYILDRLCSFYRIRVFELCEKRFDTFFFLFFFDMVEF